jgi:Zn-dependent protease
MGWSIRIGVIGGTTIRIHVTFLLLLLWIVIAHYVQGGVHLLFSSSSALYCTSSAMCTLPNVMGSTPPT